MSFSSPRIAEIARLLNRKPGSVHRKLEDIRSNEPSYIARGRRPTNCAEFVKHVWKGLYADYDGMRRRMEDAYQSVIGNAMVQEELDLEEIPPGLDVPADATRREGQQIIRCIVAMNFGQKCCVTGIATKGLLVASHIRPWAESGPKERTDPSNGLYLNRLHDGLFDKHLMTLDDDMRIEYAVNSNSLDYIKSVHSSRYLSNLHTHDFRVRSRFRDSIEDSLPPCLREGCSVGLIFAIKYLYYFVKIFTFCENTYIQTAYRYWVGEACSG